MTSAGYEPPLPASERPQTHWTKATNRGIDFLRLWLGTIVLAALTPLEYVNAAKAATTSFSWDRITDQNASGKNPVNFWGRGVGAGGNSMLCEG
jgi:hypothetical protein